ncbi:MAG: hypothetical protein V1811_02485 [Candidatus Micrarchaeota archaeon]
MRLLEQAGLHKKAGTEEKGGALAKKFEAAEDAIAVVVRDEWKSFHSGSRKTPVFFQHFIERGFLNAKIIVGSPDPHGPYRARGSELCALELSCMLGQYAAFNYPLYYLDTELREAVKKQNLFLLGGPKVNTLLWEANKSLPIRFDEKTFDVHSTLSGKTYSENVGIIEIADSPFASGRKLFVIAGNNHLATRVGVLALLKERKKLEQNNSFDSKVFAKVVQGFDEDGDGIVDAVDILE